MNAKTETHKSIWCCGCNRSVRARLTYGREVYPKLVKLALVPYWRCDQCENFVGCHHKSGTPTKPLGNIATPEVKLARMAIHRALDPLWKDRPHLRGKFYAIIAERLGWKSYHTGEIQTVEDAESVLRIIDEIKATR